MDLWFQILAIACGLMEMIYRVYAAMAIGQLSNRNRFLCSFGAYIGSNIVTSSLSIVAADLKISYISTEVYILLAFIVNVVWIILLHFLTEYPLTKKLNLE